MTVPATFLFNLCQMQVSYYRSQSEMGLGIQVHVVMYWYYFLCTMKRPPRWKRLITNLQIVQFVYRCTTPVLAESGCMIICACL